MIKKTNSLYYWHLKIYYKRCHLSLFLNGLIIVVVLKLLPEKISAAYEELAALSGRKTCQKKRKEKRPKVPSPPLGLILGLPTLIHPTPLYSCLLLVCVCVCVCVYVYVDSFNGFYESGPVFYPYRKYNIQNFESWKHW